MGLLEDLIEEYTTTEGWKNKLTQIGNNLERTTRSVADFGNPNQSPEQRQQILDYISGFGGGGMAAMTRPEIYRAIGKIPGWRQRIVNDPDLAQSIKNALRGSKQTDLDRVRKVGMYASKNTPLELNVQASSKQIPVHHGKDPTRGVMKTYQPEKIPATAQLDNQGAMEADKLKHEIYLRAASELTPDQLYKLFGHEIGHTRIYGKDVGSRNSIRRAIDEFVSPSNKRWLERVTDTSMHDADEIMAEAFARGNFSPSLAEDDMFFGVTNAIDPDLTRYLWKLLRE